MSKPKHPDIILGELKAQCKGARAHRNLDNLHKVCAGIQSGDKNFSRAVVARRTKKLGGPSLNTLYSPLGKRFRTLINAWIEWAGVSPPNGSKPPEKLTSDTALLDMFTDPVIRSLVGIRLAESRRIKSENNILKSSANSTIDLRPVIKNEGGVVITPSELLIPTERSALEQLLDSNWLRKKGWAEGPRGEILFEGKAILPIGTLSGLRKLLGGKRVDSPNHHSE